MPEPVIVPVVDGVCELLDVAATREKTVRTKSISSEAGMPVTEGMRRAVGEHKTAHRFE